MTFFDSHLHLSDISRFISAKNYDFPFNLYFCSTFQNKEEYELSLKIQKSLSFNNKAVFCGGIFPQYAEEGVNSANCEFLENCCKNGIIKAVGECGFDFSNNIYKSKKEIQDKAFSFCLNLAVQYNLPVVIHSVKSLDKIYEYSGELKKLPSVIFHSFSYTDVEIKSILSKNINAYFSFGKVLLKGSVKAASCIEQIPLDRLLLETDAPFMTLKNEPYTDFTHIQNVYKEVCALRNIDLISLSSNIENNFYRAFIIS